MKRNDILWKSILEDIFDDFLKFFFPNAEALFDLKKVSNTSIRNSNSFFHPRETSLR